MLTKYVQSTSKGMYNTYKDNESWIYAYELEMKQQYNVCIFQNESNRTKVVRATRLSKQMAVFSFSVTSHVATVVLEKRRRVILNDTRPLFAKYYRINLKKKTLEKKVNTLHYNASPHMSR
ncbi:hypothetical protein TNCT_275011 [Trichonephila clavata]|uniref:Uncharacterized protein n=1 Tax=Trichonephila clavata TaxID=2740835 RepID=A0A8X6H730_TRICU|nr:hypothetical protein TNCT_275011 [Trichonephila clavata]